MPAVNRQPPLERPGKNSSTARENMASHMQSQRSNSANYESTDLPASFLRLNDSSGTVSGTPPQEVVGLAGEAKEACGAVYKTDFWSATDVSSGSDSEDIAVDESQVAPSERQSVNRILADMHGPPLSDREVLVFLCQVIERSIGGQEGRKMACCFAKAGLSPPITKHSLSELDIGAIINNPKLRHDVNFDRELHFRPNLDGAKGRLKMRAADDYWIALTAELELYTFLSRSATSLCRNKNVSRAQIIRTGQRRIPLMFETIRDILKNLVPERDQAMVDEQLDVPVLMQQIEKGVCNLVGMSKWLAYLLKAHCAPMRDEWVDKMVKQTEIGVETGSARSIVNGLMELLGILEAMKLDVANHQIRHLRALLVEDTINFEHRYHLHRIKRGRIDVKSAEAWYWREASRESVPAHIVRNDGRVQLETFLRALVRLLLSPSSRDIFPETFYLDLDRLRALKAELHDLVCSEICCQIFDYLAIERLGYRYSIPQSTRQALRDSLFAIASECPSTPISSPSSSSTDASRHWTPNIPNIAVELVRQALHLCGCERSYDGALAQTTEQWLFQAFDSRFSANFAMHARSLERGILPRILDTAGRHINSSPVDLFNALIAPSTPPPPPPPPQAGALGPVVDRPSRELMRVDVLADIARRISHVAILHWRIWAPLVYVRSDGLKFDEKETSPRTTPGMQQGDDVEMKTEGQPAQAQTNPKKPTPSAIPPPSDSGTQELPDLGSGTNTNLISRPQ